MTAARLWGFDGDLWGNERELMARPPFIIEDGSGRVAAVRALRWDLKSGEGLYWFGSPEEAREFGTDLQLPTEAVPVIPGQFAVLAGPGFLADLDETGLTFPEGWTLAVAGFRVQCMHPDEYEQLALELGIQAARAFDVGVRRTAQEPPDEPMRAALRILQQDSLTPLEERQVRAIHAAELDHDPDLYPRLVQMTAIRLHETEDAVKLRVLDYRRVLLQPAVPVSPGFLGKLGVDPRAPVNPDLPYELRSAAEALTRLPSSSPPPDRLIKIATSSKCIFFRSPFAEEGSESSLVAQQQALTNVLEPLRLGRVHPYELKLGTVADDSYATAYRAFYLFPFVLTPRRRNWWGVIPYARHRAIGMLIDENNPYYKVWAEQAGPNTRPALVPLERSVRPVPPHRHPRIRFEEIQQTFGEFVKDMRTNNGCIYHRSEQLAGAIFKQMVEVSPLDDLGSLVGDEHENRFYKLPQDSGARSGKQIRSSVWDVFIFDLTSREDAESFRRPELAFVEIEHGLPIPVGVGFSLLATPSFFEEGGLGRWSQIQRQAARIYGEVDHVLREFGMVFSETEVDPKGAAEVA
jgi:hypothetical protein